MADGTSCHLMDMLYAKVSCLSPIELLVTLHLIFVCSAQHPDKWSVANQAGTEGMMMATP